MFQIVVLGAVTPDFVDNLMGFFLLQTFKNQPLVATDAWPLSVPSFPKSSERFDLRGAAIPTITLSWMPWTRGDSLKDFCSYIFCRFWRFCTKNPLKLQNQIFQSLGCFHHKCKKIEEEELSGFVVTKA